MYERKLASVGFCIALLIPLFAFAQTTSSNGCTPPSFYSFKIAPASLNTPWSLPLLSTIDGPYMVTVTAKGLPTGIELQDQKTTITAGASNTVLHVWILNGAPLQLGTYTINVTAQNTCGGTSTIVTLPINASPTGQGSVCPLGTTGTYPNCSPVAATTTSIIIRPATTTPTTTIVRPSVVVPTNTTLTPVSACFAVQTSLTQGNSGADVLSLQKFLIQNGLLPQSAATGYFGPLTRAAVGQFQAQQGIATSGSETTNGFGMVGPRTRALIAAKCGSTSSMPTNIPPTQNYTPVTSLPSCPKIPQPVCQNGTVISLGTDQNHCSLGSVCQSTQPIRPDGYVCPNVSSPTCSSGSQIFLGYDAYGCSLGYQCQQLVCPIIPQITCPAGQTIVTGPDANGCATVSYCVGASTPAPTSSSCPAILQGFPTCGVGQSPQTLKDLNGCTLGYYCSQ